MNSKLRIPLCWKVIPPADIENVEPAWGPVPEVGQHTDVILKEIGFDPPTIAAWREKGLI